jgi:hypothetical protein
MEGRGRVRRVISNPPHKFINIPPHKFIKGVRRSEGWRVININTSTLTNMHDVTRASLNKIGQDFLTRHFLASLHVCDTIVLGTETS